MTNEQNKFDKNAAKYKEEKYPFELVWFAGIVFFILPALGMITSSPFIMYGVFGKAAEAFIPFAFSYYVAWLIFRRVFKDKNINKGVLIVMTFVLAAVITVSAFFPEIF
jgi:hypothetical protein